MNRKTFEIIEILFPIVKRAEKEDGKLDYSKPEAFLFYLPKECIGAYKAIWEKDNTPLTIAQNIFRFVLNLALTVLLTPFVLLVWTISQLCFAARYDKKKKKKGEKSHLFVTYSALALCAGLLMFMIADYKVGGSLSDKLNKDINDKSEELSTPRKSSSRTIDRSIVEDDPTEIEFIVTELEETTIEPEITTTVEEDYEEEIVVTESVTESESEIEEPVVTEAEIIEIDEEYTIQRKVRN